MFGNKNEAIYKKNLIRKIEEKIFNLKFLNDYHAQVSMPDFDEAIEKQGKVITDIANKIPKEKPQDREGREEAKKLREKLKLEEGRMTMIGQAKQAVWDKMQERKGGILEYEAQLDFVKNGVKENSKYV